MPQLSEPTFKRPTRRKLEAICVLILLFLPLARVASTYGTFSQTLDEPYHVAAGIEWLTTDHYVLDREHPPLARVMFALPSVVRGTRLTSSRNPVEQGNSIFYRNGQYLTNLTYSRLGNLIFLLVALLTTWLLSRRVAGKTAGVISLLTLGCLPPLLGNAGLATTDMPVTAMTTAAVLLLLRHLSHPTWRNAVGLGTAAGIGLLTKFSFVVFFPLAVLVSMILFAICQRPPNANLSALLGHCVVAISIACTIVWAGYKFSTGLVNELRLTTFKGDAAPRVAAVYAREPGYSWVRADLLERYWRYANDVRQPGRPEVDFVDWAKRAGYASPKAGRHGDTTANAPAIPEPLFMDRLMEPFRAGYQYLASHVALPAPEFLVGLEYVAFHSRTGHPAFLLGEYSGQGWWYYFPVVLFFKTPLSLVLLLLAAVPLVARRAWKRRDAVLWAVLLVPGAWLAVAMTTSINIGVRHILPLYPLLVICVAFAFVQLWQLAAKRKGWRVLLAGLLFLYVGSTVAAHPDYLSYFNEVAGANPERIATDSNLDWGQDLLRLARYARIHSLHPLYVSYFGTAEWQKHLPYAEELRRNEKVVGWIAIGQMQLQFGGTTNRGDGFEWLERLKPERRIGSSIWLYRVR